MNIKRAARTVAKRGGAIRYRTINPSPGKYIHIAITKRAGPHGGKTVAGPVRKAKQSPMSKAYASAKRSLSRRR